MRIPRFFGLHAVPSRKLAFFLMLIPFAVVLGMYLFGSHYRLSQNPRDKIMPAISTMISSTIDMAIEPNNPIRGYKAPTTTWDKIKAIPQGKLLNDIEASLQRLIIAVVLAAVVGLLLGMNMALFPGMAAVLNPFITFFSNIPALALMPILLILLGTGDLTKISLIFLGIVFVIIRDVFRATNDIPKEQITKALSLGATQLEVVYKIILPQVLPALLSTVRLSLGSAWLFLIAGEAVVSMGGLGYRIYLVKRYLAMHIIIPYVFTITGLAYLLDRILKKTIEILYPWYAETKGTK